MQSKSKGILASIAAFFKAIWAGIKNIFLKIFPRREAKYFDATRHELKYILFMAVGALVINLFMESFARLTTSPLEGIRWALTNPLVFLYNSLIIFATLTFALIFKRRRFAYFIISVLWVALGTANGMILTTRMTPFTLYDLNNFADGLTIATTYYSVWQIALGIAGIVMLLLVIILIFVRSEKWKNINYKKSLGAIALSVALTFGASAMALSSGLIGTFFGNLNYAYRDYGLA